MAETLTSAGHRGPEPEPDAELIISHLRPVPPESRTMSGWDVAGLWVGMVVNIPAFYLAGGLVELGMSWWQGIAIIFAGNAIILVPLILSAHPGTRYGLPFPVILRAAFGVRGAHVPALLRALVACGWCGIETWIGGQAIALLLPLEQGSWYARTLPWLGTSPIEFSCFVFFLLAQLAIVWKGMAGIRALEKYSAPALVILTAALFCWAYVKAGGFGEMLSAPSRLTPSEFFSVFPPSLTASVGTWAGVALNIADFSRYARSQADQVAGQLGLPVYMALYTFAGLAITSSTEVIFGRLISNPIQILREIGGTFTTVVAIFGISLATITTNIPANFVAPANVLAGLSPSTFSFTKGAVLTGLVSVGFQPWRILGSGKSFVYTWLVGCSTVLSPISGILLADYYLVRRRVLDVKALYSKDKLGLYYYRGGYNTAAFAALIVAVVPTVPGFLHKAGVVRETAGVFVAIYDNAWFFGVFTAAILYWLLSCWRGTGKGKLAVDYLLLDPLRP